MLVQIDKLVQLIESPVFTCEFLEPRTPDKDFLTSPIRPPPSAIGTGEASVSVQMSVWPVDAPPSKQRLCCPSQSPERRQLSRFLAGCASNVSEGQAFCFGISVTC